MMAVEQVVVAVQLAGAARVQAADLVVAAVERVAAADLVVAAAVRVVAVGSFQFHPNEQSAYPMFPPA
jgi:hypothetical protein